MKLHYEAHYRPDPQSEFIYADAACGAKRTMPRTRDKDRVDCAACRKTLVFRGVAGPNESGVMCDCLPRLTEELRPRGIWISRTPSLPPQPLLATSWYPGHTAKKSEKRPGLVASYCPFCGERYEGADAI